MRALLKISIVLTTLWLSGQTLAETLSVIVNKASPINSLDKNEIRNIYLGRPVNLPNNTRLTPLDISENNPVYEHFYDKVISKSASQISSYWSRQIFNGKGQPPKQLKTFELLQEQVAADNKFIAYVVGEVKSADVKVIFTTSK